MNERRAEILDAACRVIAREGTHGLRMSAVAGEAGVSNALLHYYYATREELLARAFAYAEDRAQARAQAEIALCATAAERVERFLLLYLDDESVFHENWVLWNEMWTSALFDDKVRPGVREAYRRWVAWVEELIREGHADGSIPASVDPGRAALLLAASVDGLGSLLLLGLMTREQARELVRHSLELELGLAPAGQRRSSV